MGVTGLLQNLKEIQEPGTLEKYRGKTLAIDTYGWLHRGLISCAQELCQGLPTRKYITSIMKKVDMLQHFGVEPYFVFDGAPLPTKAETANERRLRREEARQKADASYNRGDKKTAWKEYMKAASVSSEMAKSVMAELDQRNIKYIVAPYEADPQMVYLEKIGLVDGILSEDSDLLIFGCNRLITKLKDDSTCIEICRENFNKVKKIPGLSNYSQEQLRLVAMLSGCDYTKGIPNIGLKTAFTLVKKYNNLEKILLALRSEGKYPSEDFLEEVNLANLAFQYQKVFHPIENELRTLYDYPEDFDFDFETLENCCGKTFDNDLYYKICNGYIHPFTHDVLVSREQNLTSLKSNSINFKPIGSNTNFQNSRKQTSNSMNSAVTATRSKSVMTLNTPRGTIDSFFKKSISENKSTEKKRSLTELELTNNTKENTSPISKKVKNFVADNEIGGSNERISLFFKKPTPQESTSSETKVWDSSLISGESDIDDFSSPPKKNISEKILDAHHKKGINYEVAGDILKHKDFGSDDLDCEIEESPVKPKLVPVTQTNFTKFAKVLRENFLFDPREKITSTHRSPLGKIDFNKNSIKNNDKIKIKPTTSLNSILKSHTIQNTVNPIDKYETNISTSPKKCMANAGSRISLENFAYKG